MDNKWTKVQEHPVLECGVMTKEDGQVKVTALLVIIHTLVLTQLELNGLLQPLDHN